MDRLTRIKSNMDDKWYHQIESAKEDCSWLISQLESALIVVDRAKECSNYLCVSRRESIGSYSMLHKNLKEALEKMD